MIPYLHENAYINLYRRQCLGLCRKKVIHFFIDFLLTFSGRFESFFGMFFWKPLNVTFSCTVLIKGLTNQNKVPIRTMNVALWQWHCHLVLSFLCHMTCQMTWYIYFRIVFRIGKRIWVKMKFSNVCCLMLTMLNNGWQKENWLLRDLSRLEYPNHVIKKMILNLNDRMSVLRGAC